MATHPETLTVFTALASWQCPELGCSYLRTSEFQPVGCHPRRTHETLPCGSPSHVRTRRYHCSVLTHTSLDVGAFSISPALSPNLLHVPGTLRFHSRLLKTPLGDPTSLVFFGGGTRGLDCNYGWTMKVQLRFWNVSFLTSTVYLFPIVPVAVQLQCTTVQYSTIVQ